MLRANFELRVSYAETKKNKTMRDYQMITVLGEKGQSMMLFSKEIHELELYEMYDF